MNDDGRSTAYGDLLSALLALHSDPATARFDAELAAAEAGGSLDGTTSRTLQWWQRQSLRGVADHLSAVLPDLLDRLAAADETARASVESASSAGSSAIAAPTSATLIVGVPEPPDSGPGPGSGPHLRPVEDLHPVDRAAAPQSTTRLSPFVPASPTSLSRVSPPTLRPGFAPAAPTAAVPFQSPAAQSGRESAEGDDTDLRDEPNDAVSRTGHIGAPPRRLLVAGLTVVNEPVHSEPPNDSTEDIAPVDGNLGPADDDAH